MNDIVFTFDTSKKEKILENVVDLLKTYLENTNNDGSKQNLNSNKPTRKAIKENMNNGKKSIQNNGKQTEI